PLQGVSDESTRPWNPVPGPRFTSGRNTLTTVDGYCDQHNKTPTDTVTRSRRRGHQQVCAGDESRCIAEQKRDGTGESEHLWRSTVGTVGSPENEVILT